MVNDTMVNAPGAEIIIDFSVRIGTPAQHRAYIAKVCQVSWSDLRISQ